MNPDCFRRFARFSQLARLGRLDHFFAALVLALALPLAAAAQTLPLERITLPPGFTIELLARVPNARQMALSPANILYVGSMREGKVHALPLERDYKPGALRVVAENLKRPVGVAWRDGSLYISAIDRILRLDDIDRRIDSQPKPVIVRDDLPTETHHGWKFIAFGPDGWLYATILRMRPDGSDLQTFARGVRNTVGFDWHPATGELWFTDNGRDLMGDDLPPDELNHAPKAGLHFGYPYCHGGTIADPEFGEKRACREFVPPAQNLGPHVAALGMRFYTGRQFPAQYRSRIFIAEHGSWNRSRKIGYRISMVTLEGNRAVAYKPFASGWLQGESAWGRPADVLVLPDGSLLVSDDHAGAVYRIRYVGD